MDAQYYTFGDTAALAGGSTYISHPSHNEVVQFENISQFGSGIDLSNLAVEDQPYDENQARYHPFSFSSMHQPASAATSIAPSNTHLSAHPILEACLGRIIETIAESMDYAEEGVPDRSSFIRDHPQYIPMLKAMEAIGISRAIRLSESILNTSKTRVQRLFRNIALQTYLDVLTAYKQNIRENGGEPEAILPYIALRTQKFVKVAILSYLDKIRQGAGKYISVFGFSNDNFPGVNSEILRQYTPFGFHYPWVNELCDITTENGQRVYRYRPLANSNLLDCFGDVIYNGDDSIACMVERDAYSAFPHLRYTCSDCDWSAKNSIIALVYVAAAIRRNMIKWADGPPQRPSSHWHTSDLDFIDRLFEETNRLSNESKECIELFGQRQA